MRRTTLTTRLLATLLGFAAGLLGAQDETSGPPPTLAVEEVVAQARARSGTLKVKLLDASRAAYALREAQSRILPQLALTGSSTYMTNPPEGIKITKGAFGSLPLPGLEFPILLPAEDYVFADDAEHTYFKLAGSLDQVLWTWGKLQKAIRIAELDRQAAEVAVRATAKETVRDVTKAYFGAAVARESAKLLENAEALAREMLADREGAYAAGTVTMQDVLESRSQAAQVSSQRARAVEGLETALGALEYYTGRRPDPASLTSPFRESLPPVDESALVASAFGASTELETLGIKSRQARLAEEIRKASLLGLPDLSLNLTLNVQGQKVPLASDNWSDTWDTDLLITIAGKVTLFDSLSSVWRLKQAQLQREQAEAGVEELARGTPIQVRRLVDAARSNAAAVVEKRAEAAFSAERARNATVSYDNEMATRADERGARMAAIASELQVLLALLQTENAIVDLEYATGKTFPRP